jgi:prephenate dehydrogenase
MIARDNRLGERILLCGLGPVAMALGRSLRRAGAHVQAQDPDPRREAEAVNTGSVDEVASAAHPLDPSLSVAVLALPFREEAAALARLGAMLPVGAVVTGLAPLMLPSLLAAHDVPGLPQRFVPSHPVLEDPFDDRTAARVVPDSAEANPFHDVTVFVGAPLEPGSAAARVAHVWRSVGARPEAIAPTLHDALVALTHQLPILSAAALTRAIRRTGSLTRSIAPGARSVLAGATLAASGDPESAAEALRRSAPKLLPALEILEREVRRLRHALAEEGDGLRGLLEEAREFRRELVS